MRDWSQFNLIVLDLGEVQDEETGEILATFDPTDEAIAAWEDRAALLNQLAAEHRARATGREAK